MGGDEIYKWLVTLFPLNRTLAGPTSRETLEFLKSIVPEISIKSFSSGAKVFDWEIPKEWAVSEAYVENSEGIKVIDFKENNLHLVGYSVPISKQLTLVELEKNLHTLPNSPDLVPYVTSYYSESWGFCITENHRRRLGAGPFKVHIDSKFIQGEMNYGELIIEGESKEEIFLSTYICHPSMANDNLSGIGVTLALAKWLTQQRNLRFTYRIIFIPETIGSIAYLQDNLDSLKQRVQAGWVITCVGDKANFSLLPSRLGNTLTDRITRKVLEDKRLVWKEFSFLDRGSDERQYCAPGCDLPVASLMRSKYGEFDEYHTSGDNLDFIDSKSLNESFCIYKELLSSLEENVIFIANTICEPNLGKRGLYPTLSTKESIDAVQPLMNVFTYCDGQTDLLSISELVKLPLSKVIELSKKLESADAIKKVIKSS